MKIAYDAKRITHNETGLGTYGRVLINNLAAFQPANDYLLYTTNDGKPWLTRKVKPSQHIQFKYPAQKMLSALGKFIWRSKGIVQDLQKEKPDLFHGLSAELPFGIQKAGIKSVVTIHDLIFLRYPYYYKWIDRQIYTYKYKKACQVADRIIAVSETTKQDIVSFFHISPDKIDVIYQSCCNEFKKQVSEESKREVRRKYQLPEHYVLYLGSIEERKNFLLLVRALKRLPPEVKVVAAGRKTPYVNIINHYIKKHHLEHRIMMLNGVPTEDLPTLYQCADVFVYPSYFEGFGIPIIEALYSGTPVIAATGSCLHESGGPHSKYVNPDKPKELARVLQEVLNNQELRKQMIEEGKKYVSRFEGELLTKQVMECYKKALSQ